MHTDMMREQGGQHHDVVTTARAVRCDERSRLVVDVAAHDAGDAHAHAHAMMPVWSAYPRACSVRSARRGSESTGAGPATSAPSPARTIFCTFLSGFSGSGVSVELAVVVSFAMRVLFAGVALEVAFEVALDGTMVTVVLLVEVAFDVGSGIVAGAFFGFSFSFSPRRRSFISAPHSYMSV